MLIDPCLMWMEECHLYNYCLHRNLSFSLLTDVFVRFKKTKEEKNSLYSLQYSCCASHFLVFAVSGSRHLIRKGAIALFLC